MAKTTGPLLSLGAGGSIADTLTFSRWKGVPYVRQRVIPSNPQTTAQTLTRNVFRIASSIWKGAPTLLVAGWNRFAVGQPLTGRNAWMKEYVARLRDESTLDLMVFSPSAKGGTPLDAIALTPGDGTISVAVTAPTPPTGWTLASVVAAAIIDGDPAEITDFTVVAAENDTTPFTVSLEGLTNGELYQVGAWPVWTRPDGSTAYGQSINDTETPAA